MVRTGFELKVEVCCCACRENAVCSKLARDLLASCEGLFDSILPADVLDRRRESSLLLLIFPDLSEEKNYSYFFSVVRILAVATVYGKSVLHHLVDEVRYELRLTALNSFCFWQT